MYFKLSVMLMDEIKGAPGTPGFKITLSLVALFNRCNIIIVIIIYLS